MVMIDDYRAIDLTVVYEKLVCRRSSARLCHAFSTSFRFQFYHTRHPLVRALCAGIPMRSFLGIDQSVKILSYNFGVILLGANLQYLESFLF
jgi:hypothetical protein